MPLKVTMGIPPTHITIFVCDAGEYPQFIQIPIERCEQLRNAMILMFPFPDPDNEDTNA